MTPKLEVRGVDYSYHTMEGETKALSDISFHVNSGEFLCIVGPSGCGVKGNVIRHKLSVRLASIVVSLVPQRVILNF